jgi:hypothetical protein
MLPTVRNERGRFCYWSEERKLYIDYRLLSSGMAFRGLCYNNALLSYYETERSFIVCTEYTSDGRPVKQSIAAEPALFIQSKFDFESLRSCFISGPNRLTEVVVSDNTAA